ncbi:MAG: hypothetical protein D6731_25725 [Planctomycetota bacterium]|nr:MAG: hypothetical protein D6731_25725 [Planctomycetota bacterium]
MARCPEAFAPHCDAAEGQLRARFVQRTVPAASMETVNDDGPADRSGEDASRSCSRREGLGWTNR